MLVAHALALLFFLAHCYTVSTEITKNACLVHLVSFRILLLLSRVPLSLAHP